MEIKSENALIAAIILIFLCAINVDAETNQTIEIISLQKPSRWFSWPAYELLLVIFALFLHKYYPRTKGKLGQNIKQFQKPS